MERETIKLTTPAGKQFEIIPYLTARERNELRNTYLSELSAEINTQNPEASKVSSINGTVYEKQEQALIKLGVISFDGSPDNILDRLLDQRPEEYDFVVSELDKALTGGLTRPK